MVQHHYVVATNFKICARSGPPAWGVCKTNIHLAIAMDSFFKSLWKEKLMLCLMFELRWKTITPLLTP